MKERSVRFWSIPAEAGVNLEYSLLEYPGQRILSTLLPRGNCSRLRGRKRFAVEIPYLVAPPQEAE